MPTILLVRHGQSSFGGAEYDVLSDLGASQAVALAEALAVRGVRVERVASGSLARQRDTAAPIAAAGACPVAVDSRWDEYDANDILEAHSTTAARLDRPSGSDAPPVSAREFQDILESALSAWIAAGAASTTRETWPAFAHRVGAALADLAADLPRGTTAVVSTSAGVLAALCVALLELSDSALLAFNRVAVNSGVTKVVHGRSGTTLVSFNEHGHLERPGGSLISYR